jgi:hypothetical protein
MSYKTKIDESFARVYAQNRSDEIHISISRFSKAINREIEPPSNSKFINEDIDQLLLIAVSRLDLPSDFADKAKLILFNMWQYPNSFHDIKAELVAFAALKYIYETDKYMEFTNINPFGPERINFESFISDWFVDNIDSNITQFYAAYNIISNLYNEVESEIESNKLEARSARTKRKLEVNQESVTNIDRIREKYLKYNQQYGHYSFINSSVNQH